tara:strand:- start:156 stop:284 length:129 start_codon:yes stop_codon:yes gene_type:complete
MGKEFLSAEVPLADYRYYAFEIQLIDYQFFLDLLSFSEIYVF